MGQWSNPPPYGYPPQPQYPSQLPPGMTPQHGVPQGGMPPPEKKGFKFQMWMLGAIIIPIGIGFAVRDVMKKSSIELGGECSDSEHCKSGTCLTGEVGQCTKTCSKLDPCPAGFGCHPVNVTLHNQGGFHNLGTQNYCVKGKGGDPASSASASEGESASASSAPPPPPVSATAAEPPPASASAPPAASSVPAKPVAKPKPKPKPKK